MYETIERRDQDNLSDDVVVAAIVVGNGSSDMAIDSDSMTSVGLELAAVWEARQNIGSR